MSADESLGESMGWSNNNQYNQQKSTNAGYN